MAIGIFNIEIPSFKFTSTLRLRKILLLFREKKASINAKLFTNTTDIARNWYE